MIYLSDAEISQVTWQIQSSKATFTEAIRHSSWLQVLGLWETLREAWLQRMAGEDMSGTCPEAILKG